MNKDIYSIVICDGQDYWRMSTDYIGTADTFEKAKEMLKDWLVMIQEDEGVTEKFDDDLNDSIAIVKQSINTSDEYDWDWNYIDLNKLLAE